ncbi:glycosyltransferase involved in cell wall biosynthesis [Shimia isoporae]|uniref:Glycosyltransferase involved in cell wall biosynthesis n=1 Tax=Shimia isoporae TaxID=647720 RepID=A0A4R1N438_9RHOB|nr:glycosyltransferase [Shimia isoporae]TCL01488.1 glycosyltransferase involved in cell wall biosynthesis [Shimia isoporae]
MPNISTSQEVNAVRVTVFMPTFNQKNLVSQALESVLSQKVDFRYEIFVHDDASSDGTREILEAYAEKHPDIIRLMLQDENQYSQGRRILALALPEFRGEYVAFLDGDDLWTNDTKLAKQVAYMDANPGCALCQTMSSYWDSANEIELKEFPPLVRREPLPGSYLATGNFVQACATILRLSALGKLPDDFDAIPFGDYAVYALAARNGWIGFIPEKMARYHFHETNTWASLPVETRIERTKSVKRYLLSYLPWYQLPFWRASLVDKKPVALWRLFRRLDRFKIQLSASN